jgi:hypothetical protein
VTLASLRERYPEIEATPDAVVTRAIGEATRRTHASVFGERRDDAIALRAMHLLAVSPQGINARIEGAKPGSMESTLYGCELLQIIREACGGAHMTGVGPLR